MTDLEIRGAIKDAKKDKKRARKAMRRAYSSYLAARRTHRRVKKFNGTEYATAATCEIQRKVHSARNAARAIYQAARSIYHDAKATMCAAKEGRADKQQQTRVANAIAAFREIHGGKKHKQAM
jgi:hypothetical protein